MKIEITIPVLDEEETLKVQILKILDFLQQSIFIDYNVSLIIGDNGSTDQTQKIAQILAKENSAVTYMRTDERGVGRILKKSWGESTADIVGYMDLDLATDMKHLKEAFEALTAKNNHIVYGSRLHKNSKVIGRSMVRAMTSRAFNLICKIYMGTKFSDGMCGFKFLDRTLYQTLYDNGAQSDGWFFSTELLIISEKLGLKVYELPITWTDDPNSKAKIFKLAKEYLKAMHKLKARYPTMKVYHE